MVCSIFASAQIMPLLMDINRSNYTHTLMYILLLESGSCNGSQLKSPGSCSALNSPCRDVPLITSLKPPIILRRGPSGFGFTVNTIRVYFGDSDFYTMHHLVMVCKRVQQKPITYLSFYIIYYLIVSCMQIYTMKTTCK